MTATGAALRRPSRQALDAALAGALVLVSVYEALTVPTNRPLWVHLPLAVLISASLAFRRLAPLVVVPVVVLGTVALDPSSEFAIFVSLLVASYTAGAELDPPRTYLGLALAVGPLFTYFLLNDGAPTDYVATAIIYGGSWVVGRAVRDRTLRVEEHARRADLAEQQREERAARAAAEERTRIARELHDVISHSISVVAVQSQAVRRRLDPSQAREIADLQAVETTARQAMAEMRRLFGVLRADTERPALEPQPGLDQLDRLVEDARASGLPVAVEVAGEPLRLPPGLDLAAYRIVQEALTNVRKHAPGARTSVCLHWTDHGLEVTVRDTGGRPSSSDGEGFGLIGMRERVTLYGGSLDAGPSAEGFTVHAVLPLREGAAA